MQQITSKVNPIIWKEDKLLVLDQRLLPYEKKYLELKTYKEVIHAIKDMVVRGAPLIGITAAYGMALAAVVGNGRDHSLQQESLIATGEEIKQSRPTAINLKWAVDLVLNDISAVTGHDHDLRDIVIKRAKWIHEDDAMRCQRMGEYGAKIIKQIASAHPHTFTSVLTICNTGALATGGIGTAFGVILTAYRNNPNIKIYAAETRPRQQGARLTTFEFVENDIECTLVPDTACGHLMQKGEIDFVITGADRIASNGDSANKIGTYQLAVLAKENNIPFYVAAPLSTFDLSIKCGDEIPIEEREEEEVTHINGKQICANGVKVRNPAFDVTPHKYITGIITEAGVLSGNYVEAIKNTFNQIVLV